MTDPKAPAGEAPAAPEPQDPLAVPMDRVLTRDTTITGSHTQETADPAERLPEDPDAQNDLA